MSDPVDGRVHDTDTDEKLISLDDYAVKDVNIKNTNPDTPVTSEETSRQIRAVTDPQTKQLKLLRELMEHLRQSTFRSNEETGNPVRGSLRSPKA